MTTLSGAAINYTGPTSVSGGQLILYNAGAYNSPTTVHSGGILSWNGTTNVGNGAPVSASASIALQSGGTLQNLNPSAWTWLNGSVTVSGTTTINQASNATASNIEGFFFDGGLKGSGTCTINALNAGSGVNLRTNSSTFAGTLIVNGIAGTAPYAGSGLGVGGCTTGLANADIILNGTMELGTGGIGWANNSSSQFLMGALSGTGDVVANGSSTTIGLGNTSNSGTFSGVIANGTGGVVTLVKTGTGSQVFSGANTYSGATTVSAGALLTGRQRQPGKHHGHGLQRSDLRRLWQRQRQQHRRRQPEPRQRRRLQHDRWNQHQDLQRFRLGGLEWRHDGLRHRRRRQQHRPAGRQRRRRRLRNGDGHAGRIRLNRLSGSSFTLISAASGLGSATYNLPNNGRIVVAGQAYRLR